MVVYSVYSWYSADGTFVEQGVMWGFGSALPALGCAVADVDGDGDLDAVIASWTAVEVKA